MHRTPNATPHEVRTLSVDTHRDPRAVANVLAGRPCKHVVRAQVLAAVRARGWAHLLPAPEAPATAV